MFATRIFFLPEIHFRSFSCQSSHKHKLVIHQASKISYSQMNFPQIIFIEPHLEFFFCQKHTICFFSEANANCIEEVSLRSIQIVQRDHLCEIYLDKNIFIIWIKPYHFQSTVRKPKSVISFCSTHWICDSACFLWQTTQKAVSNINNFIFPSIHFHLFVLVGISVWGREKKKKWVPFQR